MQVHIFRGPGRIFGVTEDTTASSLPSRFAPWTSFKTIELERGLATPGLNNEECLNDIEQHGFHVTDAHVRITQTLV